VEISPGVPSPLTLIGLIQRRPYSAAKKVPSSVCGNFTAELSPALYRYTGPPIGDSEPLPNSGGVESNP
jgi:hypothetical protein